MRLRLLAPFAILLCACSGSIGAAPAIDAGTDGSAVPCNADGAARFSCGGVCTDLASDANNCGRCGNACGGGALCCDGACVATASCDFAITSLNPASGYLNGGGWVRLHGAGFTRGLKVWIGDGRAPARVLDAENALVLTPPGPLGNHDVKIAVANQEATLRRGFSYVAGQLGQPWEQKPLATVRGEDPGLAVMQDGRVLVAGGTKVPDKIDVALDTAEIYTRDTDTVVPAAGKMSTARWQDAAVTLLDGRVLVVGGACFVDLKACNGDPRAADLFDPATDTFRPTATPLNKPRVYPRAALLPDGRVFIASANDPSVEIYDPETGAFTLLPHNQPHVFGFIARLRDGRVMLGGGDGAVTAVELFDAETNLLVQAVPLNRARSMLTAHTLPDGRVLVIGGASQSAGGIHVPQDTIEAFDPAKNAWTVLPYKLGATRAWHASALVRDGTILVMGGYTVDGKCDSLADTVDQIDPVMAVVTPFATLPNKNTEWTAVTLLDGSVLGVGGGACGAMTALPDIDFLPGGPG